MAITGCPGSAGSIASGAAPGGTGGLATVEGAISGLMGLLLAFTISGALQAVTSASIYGRSQIPRER
jgi:hypothetical protein